MVEQGRNIGTGAREIVLRPNASLCSRHGLLLLAGLGLVMGIIAILAVSMGAWLVLPFSGLEWFLLAYCFHLARKQSTFFEVITIGDSLVELRQGHGLESRTYQFQRAWLVIDWRQSPFRGHASHLFFRLHSKAIEIGRFLVEDERKLLARELKNVLATKYD